MTAAGHNYLWLSKYFIGCWDHQWIKLPDIFHCILSAVSSVLRALQSSESYQ